MAMVIESTSCNPTDVQIPFWWKFYFDYTCVLTSTTSILEGGFAADTAGGNFTPHVVNVQTGEVTRLVKKFALIFSELQLFPSWYKIYYICHTWDQNFNFSVCRMFMVR